MENDINKPSEELIKECFARFGLAYYYSECLHRELCNIYAITTFERKDLITRPRLEEKLSQAFSLPLGPLIEVLKSQFPEDLYKELEYGLKKRNFLAHHFWYERSHLVGHSIGVSKMIDELTKYACLFQDLDKNAQEFFRPIRESLGITDEVVEKELDELLSGVSDEPLIQQRKLKNKERIINAWSFKMEGDNTTIVFETEDGCLWQFCDVGLGWTMYNKVEPSWIIRETIQRYLPATVNPRPKTEKPWHYEIRLSDRAVLWVKPGKHARTHVWGIKTG